MKSGLFMLSMVFICLALLVLLIVSVVMIAHNNRGGDKGDDECGQVMVCPTPQPYPTPCPTPYQPQCPTPCPPPCPPPCPTPCPPPCPQEAYFEQTQTLNSTNVDKGNASFGNSMANTGEWMAVAQSNTPLLGEPHRMSNVYTYKNVSYNNRALPPNFIPDVTITVEGFNPIVAMSRQSWAGGNRTYMTIATSFTEDDLSITGRIYEYGWYNNLWFAIGTSNLLAPPDNLTQYQAVAGVVSNSVVYLYTAGVVNATFSSIGAMDVSMDGNVNYSYLLIGCQGAAYMFTKKGSPEGGNWGTPRTYMGSNEFYGNEVNLQLPLFTISDYKNFEGDNVQCGEIVPGDGGGFGNSRLIVYSAENICVPATCIILNPDLADQYSNIIVGSNVIVSTDNQAVVYARSTSPHTPDQWSQSYIWEFVNNVIPINVDGYGTIVAIKNLASSTDALINIYRQLFNP